MIEIEHKNVSNVDKVINLRDGAVFSYENEFYIKTDEVDDYGDPQCVRLKDGYMISPDADTLVPVAHSVKMEVQL